MERMQVLSAVKDHPVAEGLDFWSRVRRFFRRQRADRHIVHHPVNLQRVWGDPRAEKWKSTDFEKAKGLTRDLSATGVYFETDVSLKEGSMIRFTIDFQASPTGQKTQLECRGYVVRTEARGSGKLGIAVKLDEQHLRTSQ